VVWDISRKTISIESQVFVQIPTLILVKILHSFPNLHNLSYISTNCPI